MEDQAIACEIVMERSMNEQWGVTETGECDFGDFQCDGGASEFSGYLCVAHDYSTDSWKDMQRHKQENINSGESE